MQPRTALALLLASAAAHAQSTTQATLRYSLSWSDSGNNNGLIEPGESAIVRLSITMNPGVDTAIAYTPAGGGSATGTLRGIGSAFLDLVAQSLRPGVWTNLALTPAWDFTGAGAGQVVGGSIQSIRPGQNPAGPGAVNTTNPLVHVWSARFTPFSYANPFESASFSLAPAQASGGDASRVLILNSAGGIMPLAAPSEFAGALAIAGLGVPAPSLAPAAAVALGLARARRRSR